MVVGVTVRKGDPSLSMCIQFNDDELMGVLKEKTQELYRTLYEDPLNGINLYFPITPPLDIEGTEAGKWWLELVINAQVSNT